jgi:hypothetical protein
MMVAAALVALDTARMVVECAVPVTILDQWAQLVGARTITLSWLFSQHNEHRLLFARLIFVADRWFFAETGKLSLAVSGAIQIGLLLLLLRLGRAAGLRSGVERALAATGVVALIAWAVQFENYTWPFQVQFFGIVLAAAACFAAVAMVRATVWGAALVVVLGFVATFTLSSGVAVLFVATALAIWLGRPKLYVAVVAIAAVAMLAGYLIGYHTPVEHSDPLVTLHHPVELLRYTAGVLGSPFASANAVATGMISPVLSEVIGAGGLLALVVLGWPHLRRGAAVSPAAAALVTLCVFVLAMSLLTALGRLKFGQSSALASRYTTPVVAFWACLLLLGMIRMRRPVVAGVVIALLVLFIGWTQPGFVRIAQQVAADRAISMPALVAGVADAKVIAPIYDTPVVPLQVRLTQFSTRTGVFSQVWAPWIGTPLQDHTRLTDPARCDGQFDTAIRIDDKTYPGWRVLGELTRPSIDDGRQVMALTRPDGVIMGYGISDADTTTLTVAGPAGAPARTGWVGAVTGADPTQDKAFVLLDGFRTACPLRNLPQVETQVQVALTPSIPAQAIPGGSVDAVYLNQYVTIDGWALVQTKTGTPQINLDTNLPVQTATVASVARPDVAAALKDPVLAKAGFRVVLMLDPAKPVPSQVRLCVWSKDRVYGTRKLGMDETAQALCPR